MPPKKKGGKKKSPKVDAKREDVLLFVKLLRGMQKAAEIPNDHVIDQFVLKMNEGKGVPALIFIDHVDIPNFKILCDALHEAKFDQLKSIRFANLHESAETCIKALAPYIGAKRFTCKLEELHITNSVLNDESLNVLASALKTNESINMLRLDYCKIGSDGFEILSSGLACNPQIRSLSFQFCDLDHCCAISFSRTLIFIDSHIEELNLRGNKLGLSGVLEILSVGCRRAKHLRYINLADNKLTDSPELIDGLAAVMRSRTNIERYSLVGNLLTDATAGPLITLLSTAAHIKSLTLPVSCSNATLKLLDNTLANGKPKKGKKKGKKKSAKK